MTSVVPWDAPEWRADAEVWIRRELEGPGQRVTGPITEVRVRPWTLVLRVPVDGGAVFFKGLAASVAGEATLSSALAAWRPDCVLPVLAADPARRMVLLPDGGQTVRTAIQAAPDLTHPDLTHWERILPLYAGLQRDMIAHADELLALGALDRRLRSLPGQYERLLDDTSLLRIGEPDGLTPERYDRARRHVPRVREMAEELASYGIPETLEHDDFHDGNIFVQGNDGGQRYLFFDWGDACVSHPFCSLLVTLNSVAYRFGLAGDAPEIVQLRDIYLERWRDYGDHATLTRAAALARKLGMLCRALTWHHQIAPLPDTLRAEYPDQVPGWLDEFVNGV